QFLVNFPIGTLQDLSQFLDGRVFNQMVNFVHGALRIRGVQGPQLQYDGLSMWFEHNPYSFHGSCIVPRVFEHYSKVNKLCLRRMREDLLEDGAKWANAGINRRKLSVGGRLQRLLYLLAAEF